MFIRKVRKKKTEREKGRTRTEEGRKHKRQNDVNESEEDRKIVMALLNVVLCAVVSGDVA